MWLLVVEQLMTWIGEDGMFNGRIALRPRAYYDDEILGYIIKHWQHRSDEIGVGHGWRGGVRL